MNNQLRIRMQIITEKLEAVKALQSVIAMNMSEIQVHMNQLRAGIEGLDAPKAAPARPEGLRVVQPEGVIEPVPMPSDEGPTFKMKPKP